MADPEEAERIRAIQREKNRRWRERKVAYWSTGTEQALQDKTNFLKKNSERASRSRAKQDTSSTSRSTSYTPRPKPAIRRRDLSHEERLRHDNEARKARQEKMSRQLRTAKRLQKNKKAKENYYKKKASTSQPSSALSMMPPILSPSLFTPSSHPLTSTPISTMPTTSQILYPTPTSPQILHPTPTSSHVRKRLFGTSKPQDLRRHCNNTSSMFKTKLKKSFTDEEQACMTSQIVCRRTPKKMERNIDRILENPKAMGYIKRIFDADFKKRKEAAAEKRAKRRREKRNKCAGEFSATQTLRQKKAQLFKNRIERFFRSSLISRNLAHARYATKKNGAAFCMTVTLRDAWNAFKEVHQTAVSYSYFTKCRPRGVKLLGQVPAETCLCVTCTNGRLKIQVLNRLLPDDDNTKKIPSVGSLWKLILCPYKGEWPKAECIKGECAKCEDPVRPFSTLLHLHGVFFKEVKWYHWERHDVGTTKKLDIHVHEGYVEDLLLELEKDLKEPTKGMSLVRHLFNAYWQQHQYDLCKETLPQGQLLMLQDFAENRKALYNLEVKSAHFGKAQATLHPTVCFYRDGEGHLVRHVVMHMTDHLGHDHHAVHAFTEGAINLLKSETIVDGVILWSDGSASQYKGKGSFADLSLYPFPVQRNYFGSEHGKGEADGETGRFSQALTRARHAGGNFKNAKDMVDLGNEEAKKFSTDWKKYTFIEVPREDIITERPHTDVPTVPGTRSFHQVVRTGHYKIKSRNLSCFCTACAKGMQDKCVWSSYVNDFNTFTLKASEPLDDPTPAVVESMPEPEPEPEVVSVYTNTEKPKCGAWINVRGMAACGGKKMERIFKANVVDPPEHDNEDTHMWVIFYKRVGATYVPEQMPPRKVQLVPNTEEDYHWTVIADPLATKRGAFFWPE